MVNYKEILRLQSLGFNNTQIAEACGCARSTVISTLQCAKIKGLTWENVRDYNEKDIFQKLFPSASTTHSYKMPDYDYVHREMKKSGVTLNLLWLEYCEMCRTTGEIPYKSTQFNKYYADYVHKTKATMRLEHKPGETIQVDWAGQTLHIIDTDTGEPIKEYLFVAVLPCSGYAYVEAFQDMKQESWITAHVNAFRHFGGTARILIPDNLKTGITKNTKDELVLNRSYREMAEHYGTAIIPARPRAPKDKAAVEGTVGIVETFILAALRNQQFLSHQELNEAIWERLYEFNHKPFQKKSGSRASDFEEEKLFLLPLPEHHFELAEWKVATVQYNYHITADMQNYSVPYEYIRQKVDVRIAKDTVEVFFEGTRIASHLRLCGNPNRYSTLETHMPPNHREYIRWNAESFISRADKVGPNAAAVIKAFLGKYTVEQQGYKSCIALLKLTEKYSPERLEAACSKAFSFTSSPSFKSILSILRSGQDKLPEASKSEEENLSVSQYGFTRGAKYYEGGDE